MKSRLYSRQYSSLLHAFDRQKIEVSGGNGRYDGFLLLRVNILSV